MLTVARRDALFARLLTYTAVADKLFRFTGTELVGGVA